MRKSSVLYKEEEAGILSQNDDGTFLFQYTESWLTDDSKPSISLTLPKKEGPFTSDFLFAIFQSLLPEGMNKQSVCFHNRLDENDDFSILMIDYLPFFI